MPYYIYCIRCNHGGSYQHINQDCPKCDGTGNDWRDDNELENYHKWSKLKLDDLVREKTLISEDGIEFFYQDRIPSIKEERLQLKLLSSNEKGKLKKNIQLNGDYDFYIEPCQLCISRNGSTYDSCGWCHDSDTHHKTTDGTYAGDWVVIPHKGDGYPFHELPHPTRRYYLNKSFLEGSEGVIPNDVTKRDIKGARARNEAVSGMLGLLNSGSKRTLSINPEHVNGFINKMSLIYQNSVSSPSTLDFTGKIEFRFLTYKIFKKSGDLSEDMSVVESLVYGSRKQWEALTEKLDYKELCEVVAHESFHIIQAITSDSTGMRFDAERRLCILKWMLIEDFFLDRNGKVPFGTDAYQLLHHLDTQSEIYHYISRNFDYCRSDADLINNYSHNSQHFDLNMLDIIEGNAFVFQKVSLNRGVSPDEILGDDRTPEVYLNAFKHYTKNGGDDPIEFTLFSYISLTVGLIVDEDDLINKPYSPVSLFGYLCSLKNEHSGFLEYSDFNEISSLFEIHPLLERMGYSIESSFTKLLENKEISDLRKFLVLSLKYKKLHTEIFTFLKHVGITKSDYKNMKDLIRSQNEVRSGQANERLAAVKKSIFDELSISDHDVIVPFLLSFDHHAMQVMFKVNELTNDAQYQGAFGEEIVTTFSENTTMDIIERIDDCMEPKKEIFCCDDHGYVDYEHILSCTHEGGLNNIVLNRLSKKLHEMIGSEEISATEA
jgi:hypothetical protein